MMQGLTTLHWRLSYAIAIYMYLACMLKLEGLKLLEVNLYLNLSIQ